MRLRHIEVFHAVYTCGSITAAAEFLQVSQPSVSKVLAHAEMQLGYPLFDRIKGKIIPTREAERLIGLVSGVYQSIDELRQVSANLAKSDTGSIRIAVAPAFGIDMVPAAIASYLEHNENAKFDVETLHFNQVVRALNQSRIDLGMVFNPSAVSGMTTKILATAEFMVVARKEDLPARNGRIRLEEIKGQPLVNLSDRGPLGLLLSSRLADEGIAFNSSVTAETYQIALAVVAHGAGIAIIDEITVRSMNIENLSTRKLDPPLHFNVALMVSENEPLSVSTQRFVTHLEEHVKVYLQAGDSNGV